LTAAAQFNVKKFTSEAMDVITDPDVDAVWICSPSQYHADQIKACAENGKHVFCEKPIATDLAETVEAINACNEAGVKLMIGLQRRFDSNFMRVREAIKEKEVGDTIMVRGPVRRVDPRVCSKLSPFVFFVTRSSCALATRPLLRSNTSRAVAESLLIWPCTIST
jgi:predicted dehydrogenase